MIVPNTAPASIILMNQFHAPTTSLLQSAPNTASLPAYVFAPALFFLILVVVLGIWLVRSIR